MPQPVTDRGEIHSGLEQVDGGRVTHSVGMKSLARESGSCGLRSIAVLQEEIAHSKARERLAPVIEEEPVGRPAIDTPLLAEARKHRRGLGPERAESFLATLAEQPHLERSLEPKVANAEIQDLLHPRSGVEHRRKECVITPAIERRAVDRIEDRLDLLVLEVVDRAGSGAFEGNCQDPLTVAEVLGIAGCEVAEEGMNRRQANISSRGPTAALFLEVAQEIDHLLGSGVLEVEIRDRLVAARCHEAKEQLQTVAVALDRVWTQPSESRQVIGEEIPQAAREGVGVR